MMRRLQARLGLSMALGALGLAGLSACSSYERPKPVPLQPLEAAIAGRQVWQASAGGSIDFPLAVAQRKGQIVVAAGNGTVLAVAGNDGHELWRARVHDDLSAGVGFDGRFAAVVTRDNELVVLDAGVERWRAVLDAKVVTAPLVAGERVFVMGVDRVVHAFDVQDGRKLWTFRRPGDALTLAQAGVLAAYKDTLLAGQGSRLVGLDPLKGTVRWEAAVATPRGTNEVERLADLIGPMARVGNSVCVRAFQNAVGCVDVDRGTMQWSNTGGGIEAVAADADYVFSADASDRVMARRRTDGATAWATDRFLNRQLSAPLSTGKTVVFGDLEGQVHFLARDTGKSVLRLPTDGSAVVAAPVMVDDTTLLVVTRRGGLFAFRPQ
jgi:outer membrane protein assembly factor BamB